MIKYIVMKNTNEKTNKILKKLVGVTLLFVMLFSFASFSEAIDVRRTYYGGLGEVYPKFDEMIQALQSKHPNWTFIISFTQLNWSDVINGESTGSRNVYSNGYQWVACSPSQVEYYMDPRNFLNDTDVFQFEQLSYNENVHNLAGVQSIISGTWMERYNYYLNAVGERIPFAEGENFAKWIYESAARNGISPYHLAARIIQEQGRDEPEGWGYGEGWHGENTGLYNLLNIEAYDSSPITSGLAYSARKGLDTPQKAIEDGAKFLADGYITDGQDTLYFQKFNVTGEHLYSHQYMTNVAAAYSEARTTKANYDAIGLTDAAKCFVVPVYDNMWTSAAGSIENAVTESVRVTGDDIRFRNAPSTNANVLKEFGKGSILLRVEKNVTQNGGYTWDRVVADDGTYGYIATNFVEQIDHFSNCNESVVITGDDVALRNGPGTTNSIVKTYTSKNEAATRIEKGIYAIDGYNWDKIILSDGTVGYMASQFLEGGQSSTTPVEIKRGRVIYSGGLSLKTSPTGSWIKDVDYNEEFQILEESNDWIRDHIWYKIKTTSGATGYIAACDRVEWNIEIIGNTPTTQPEQPKEDPAPANGEIKGSDGSKSKISNSNVYFEPNSTIESLTSNYSNVKITKTSGEVVSSGIIATGYTINIGNNTYKAVKLGDPSGDGDITPSDYVKVKNHITGKTALTDAYLLAADVNGDGKITPADYVKIKNQITNASRITLN